MKIHVVREYETEYMALFKKLENKLLDIPFEEKVGICL